MRIFLPGTRAGTPPGTRRRTDDSVGSMAPFVAIVAIALMLLGALVVDGARQLDAKGRATAYAEEAARAGVQRIMLGFGDTKLDEQLAEQAVTTYCDVAMEQDESLKACAVPPGGIVAQSDDPANPVSVTVNTEVSLQPILLDMVGVGSLDAQADASATPQQGITSPQEAYSLSPGTVSPITLDPSISTDPPGPDTTVITTEGIPPNCDFYEETPLEECGPPHCDDDINTPEIPVCVENTVPPTTTTTTPTTTGPPGQPNCDDRPGGLPPCHPPNCDDEPPNDPQSEPPPCVPAGQGDRTLPFLPWSGP